MFLTYKQIRSKVILSLIQGDQQQDKYQEQQYYGLKQF